MWPRTVLPDYADRLDGVILDQYRALPDGGTRLVDIASMPRALASIDLTLTGRAPRASELLADRGAPARVLGLPIGVRATDAMIEALSELTGAGRPAWLLGERGRLLDAYADGHKYVFGARVGLYGDPEFVAALAGFLAGNRRASSASAQLAHATAPCPKPWQRAAGWLGGRAARRHRFRVHRSRLRAAQARSRSWAAAKAIGSRTRSAYRCFGSDFRFTIDWAPVAFFTLATGARRGSSMNW